jgi:hypothetical protein
MEEISAAQLTANRANGQFSPGPVTAEGKARSSRNAYRHGLTARIIALSEEDLPIYQALVQSFLDRYQPQTIDEHALVQIIADSHWKIDRSMTIDEDHRNWVDTQVQHIETCAFPNLSLYLTRIFNMMNRCVKQLEALQANRKAEEKQRLEEAILLAKYHKMLNEPFDPQENGFVFSASNLDREIGKRELLEQAALAGKYNFDLARYRFRLEQEAKYKAA